MAPKTKFDPNDPAVLATITLFKTISLNETKALETVRNSKTTSALQELIDRNNLASKSLEEKQANLVLHLALQGSRLDPEKRDFIVGTIVDGRLKTNDQVTGMLYNCHDLDQCSFSSEFSCHQVSGRDISAS